MTSKLWLWIGIAINLLAYWQYKNEDPYMDEFFHIRQAQQYCNGNFSHWNPKITTFPGVYFLAVGIMQQASLPYCPESFLRSVSLLLSFMVLLLLQWCRSIINKKDDSVSTMLYLLPTSGLYYVLFYTDTASLASFLLCYGYALHSLCADKAQPDEGPRRRCRDSIDSMVCLLFAMLTVFMRQTNAVWLLFIAGTIMLEELEHMGLLDRQADLTAAGLLQLIRKLWTERAHLIALTWPLLLPVAAFGVFVLHNGGVVVGDRANHTMSLHWAMLAHPLLIYAALMAPRLLAQLWDHGGVWERVKHLRLAQLLGYGVVFAAGAAALVWGCRSHPFLLSDNRHYTFYIWRRLLQHANMRLLLAPIYGIAAVVTVADLRQRRSGLWLVILLCAMVLTLLPTPLLEPRYFTQAVVVAALNSPSLPNTSAATLAKHLQLLMLTAAHAMVLYVFLYKPFTWSDGSVARFMF